MTTGPEPLSPMQRRAVDQLLIQYLELPERAQSAWLRQTVQRLPRLGRWLERLVADSNTVTFLDDSVRRLAGESVDRMEINIRRLAPGDRLGPWEVIAEVGQGGMGRVYRGRRADGAFDMEVAIKQIGQRRRGLAELLQRECRLLARLDHPSVTRLVDAGLDDQAGPFLIMEWVEGTDLSEWLSIANPGLNERIRLFELIAASVAHAHQRLVIHGDIKPNNIRIRADGKVKLMDFGVANLVGDESLQSETRALTPSFAAPEQIGGEPISTRSDVWALGALLYWLLTGSNLPRKAATAEAALRSSGIARSRELLALIAQATHSDPEQRYASASHLAEDVRRFLHHRPLRAVPPSTGYRLRKFIHRNPILSAASFTLATLACAALATIILLYIDAEQSRERAEQHAREVEEVADFQARQLAGLDTIGMASDLRQKLQSHDAKLQHDELDLAGFMVSLLNDHLLEPSHAVIEQQFHDQPQVRARLLLTLAGTRRGLGLFDKAHQTLELAESALAEHAVKPHPLSSATKHQRGLILSNQGHHEDAVKLLRNAYKQRQEMLSPLHRDTLVSLRELASALESMGDLEQAAKLYGKALIGRHESLGADHPETMASVNDMGNVLLVQGQPEAAARKYRQAIEGMERALGRDHPTTLDAIASLGVAIRRQGKLAEAEPYYVEALERRRNVLGHRHPYTIRSVNNLAVLYQVMGRLTDAESLYRESITAYTELFGLRNPDTLNTMANLGVLLGWQGKLGESESLLRETLGLRREVLGDDHPFTIVSMSSLASILLRTDQPEEALTLITPVHESRLQAHGKANPSTLIAMSLKGSALRKLGELDRARELGETAVAQARAILPGNHWQIANHLSQFGATLTALGEFTRADALLNEAHDILISSLGSDHFVTLTNLERLDQLQQRRQQAE